MAAAMVGSDPHASVLFPPTYLLHLPRFNRSSALPPGKRNKTQKLFCTTSSSPSSLASSSPQTHLDDCIESSLAETHHSNSDFRYLIRLAIRFKDLHFGRAAHAIITRNSDHGGDGIDDVLLGNCFINMYIKLGCVDNARKVFDRMHFVDVASYSSLVSAYAKNGEEEEAIGLFLEMQQMGIEPNGYSFVAILTCCIRRLSCRLGSQIHGLVFKTNYISSLHVSNALLGLYAKRGSLDDAVQVFSEMPERDVSSWNVVILAMVEDSRFDEAFELLHDMRSKGLHGDRFSLTSLLTASVEEGEKLHAYCIKIGLELDLSVGNALIGFYTNFGCEENVVDLFERMPEKDMFSCNGMISGFMRFGSVESAVQVFNQMEERNSISYSNLLSGFCHNGKGIQGLQFFKGVVEKGIEISDYILTSAIAACTLVSERGPSEQIHGFVVKVGCGGNPWVEATLLDMCAKCGRTEDAKKMMDSWSDEESYQIACTSLISSYSRNGLPEEAIALFHTMLQRGNEIRLDGFASATILGVCGTLGFEDLGKQLHCFVLKSGGTEADPALINSVCSMYAKCGDLAATARFFPNLKDHRTAASWNAIITAFLLHRHGDEALDVWDEMQRKKVAPDSITFLLLILSSMYMKSSTKSIESGWRVFSSMTMKPTSEHYSAIIKLLCYFCQSARAEELLEAMPAEAKDAHVWRGLLEGCIRSPKPNPSLMKLATKELLALEPRDPSTYALVSNLYSASGRWNCSERVRKDMKTKGLQKNPARSWVVFDGAVRSFYTRDRSDRDVNAGLEVLILECMKKGYEPDTSFVLQEVEEYQKRDFLFYHSAKLAVTFGILAAGKAARRPVMVMKNVRLCDDCHAFVKLVSVVTRRRIELRDSTGFHLFSEGACSCGDCW